MPKKPTPAEPTQPTIERVKLASFRPAVQNPNAGNANSVPMIVNSITMNGAGRPMLADRDGEMIAGSHSLQAFSDAGFDEAIVIKSDGTTPIIFQRTDVDIESAQGRSLQIGDNTIAVKSYQQDDALMAALLGNIAAEDARLVQAAGFEESDVRALMESIEAAQSAGAGDNLPRPSLADRFIVPPFSVLDARQGYWQERKRQWLALGIQSEIGRGENLGNISATMAGITDESERAEWNTQRRELPGKRIKGKLPADSGGQPLPLDRMANGKSPARTFAQDLMRGEHVVGMGNLPINSVFGPPENAGNDQSQTGTSIFDPVLCELAYRWFCPPQGAILDPFAGGSVRGIVASLLGRAYTGIDLRAEQVEANEAQAGELTPKNPPRWITADSRNLDQFLNGEMFDFVFSCPPYFDLEIYSDDAADLSNTGDYGAFIADYRAIIAAAVQRLNNNRFACFVVGDIRDKRGMYRNFVSDTIAAFQDAGALLYNEAILVTAVGSLPIRVGKQFSSGRKLGKTHQNVLVFIKGDARQAVADCGMVKVEVPEFMDSEIAALTKYGEELIVS